jgi:hypothetical protein
MKIRQMKTQVKGKYAPLEGDSCGEGTFVICIQTGVIPDNMLVHQDRGPGPNYPCFMDPEIKENMMEAALLTYR